MSVEYCVLRMPLQEFDQLQEQPDMLARIVEEFYTSSSEAKDAQEFVDSREILLGVSMIAPVSLRMLYLDEFTTSLLVSFTDESSPFFEALAGWGSANILKGVRYGHGDVTYYPPQKVAAVVSRLDAYADALLAARFWKEVDHFRVAAGGYFPDDQAMLTHLDLFAGLLRRLYREAAEENQIVVLLIV